jgi:hypothetical protein
LKPLLVLVRKLEAGRGKFLKGIRSFYAPSAFMEAGSKKITPTSLKDL